MTNGDLRPETDATAYPIWVRVLSLLVLAALICIGLLMAAPHISAKVAGVLGPDNPSWVAGDFVPILVIFVPLALCGWAGARWLGAGRIATAPRPLADVSIGLIIGAAGFSAAFALTATLGIAQIGIKPWPMTGLSLAAGTLAFLIQTGAEELFFRGWVQGAISRFWGAWPAILLSSILFALVHSVITQITPLSLANVFLAGIFFGSLYHFTGGIAAPIAAHFAWNWSEAMLFGLSPNGNSPGTPADIGQWQNVYGSVYDYDLKGAAMMGGSVEGMNASVAVGIILLVLIALLILSRRLGMFGSQRVAATHGLQSVGTNPVAQPLMASARPQGALRVQDDAITHVGRVREVNEDSLFASRDIGVWAVADGMGGHEFGERASKAIVDSLSLLQPVNEFEAKISAVRAAILSANETIYGEAQQLGQRMGSTVVSLVVVDRQYAVLWAGDSRAYLYRNGQLRQISRDHTQVQSMIDRGLLAPEDAAGHPMSHVLARAIGVMQNVDVDVVRDTIEPNDIFLLCSDGLYGLVSDAEIAERLAPSRLTEAADALVELSLERGAPDNVTAIAVAASEVTILSFGKDRTDSM